MSENRPEYFQDLDNCVQSLIDKVGKTLVVAAPFGIGKPNSLLNALYQRAKNDSSLHLTLLTALNLNRPGWSSDLERRLVEPMRDRLWEGYEDLQYSMDLQKGNLPSNVDLVQFFFLPGQCLKCDYSQQNFLCSNYTHAVRDGMIQGVNVLVQMVSSREINGQTYFSMGSSPDTHLEAGRHMRQYIANGANMALVAQVNPNMPFMYGEACIEPQFYDIVLDNRKLDFKLYNTPKESLALSDWSIGLHASSLIQDGGTVQIGIGSLGDAMVGSMLLRHKDNRVYQDILGNMDVHNRYGDLLSQEGGTGVFRQGLHGSSEMLVDTMIELYREDILKRRVYDNETLQFLLNEGLIDEEVTPDTLRLLLEHLAIHSRLTEEDCRFLVRFGIFRPDVQYSQGKLYCQDREISNDLEDEDNFKQVAQYCLGSRLTNGTAINASFFLGPSGFYEYLHSLAEENLREINMRGVEYVNQLYGGERLKRLQRKKGRFINTALMMRLNGAVIAHTLDNCRVISGPGGQYNFVAMAHALPDARSIITLRSTRAGKKETTSNIVWEYGATTIPRHLRDIVITEYGIADLRGKRDKEIISQMLNITDSRFQDQLMRQAKEHGKLPRDHRIPDRYRQNTPEMLRDRLKPYQDQGHLSSFPFGTDFTQEEVALGQSLKAIAAKTGKQKAAMLFGLLRTALGGVPERAEPYLQRMQLQQPGSLRERLQQKVVLQALRESGKI